MTLTEYEASTALWNKLKEHITTRIQTLREKNDGNLDIHETIAIRGAIRTFKEILAYESRPEEEPSDLWATGKD
jgi:exopolyphosphatase/pppGpp-phosphohydrolase